jgi:hypothetical protein
MTDDGKTELGLEFVSDLFAKRYGVQRGFPEFPL